VNGSLLFFGFDLQLLARFRLLVFSVYLARFISLVFFVRRGSLEFRGWLVGLGSLR
jgi:hypothetical protein